MPECTADANWSGTVMNGSGSVALASGVWEGAYGTPEAADATNPEELLAASHASCFAMTAAYILDESGYDHEGVDAEAAVALEITDDGFDIPSVTLDVEAAVPDASEAEFQEAILAAEHACPVSGALTGTDIEVNASLRR